jgi:hypothetical protein
VQEKIEIPKAENVDAMDVTKHTSAINGAPGADIATAQLGAMCFWNGRHFPPGSTICTYGNAKMECKTKQVGSSVIAYWENVGLCTP